MKIALYKNVEYVFESVCDVDSFEEAISYIRISDIVDIEFDMLDSNEIAQQEIAVIDDQIKVVMAESENKLTELKRKRSELLAIGCDDNEAEEFLNPEEMAFDKADQEYNARMEDSL